MKRQSIQLNIFSKEPYRTIIISVIGSLTFAWLAIIFMSSFGLQRNEASLILAFNNEGQRRVFQGKVVEGMTILDALVTSSEAGEIHLEFDIGSNNKVRIKKLNGYFSEPNKNLTFYLNNTKVKEESINMVGIKPGDIVEIQLD